MPNVSEGYTAGTSGYFKNSDGSGPYTIDSSGVATLISATSVTLTSGADRSGQIAVAGTAQPLAAANTKRSKLTGQNISTGDLWINETGANAVIDGAGSYRIPAGATFSVNTNRAVSIIGATAGQKFTATEVS